MTARRDIYFQGFAKLLVHEIMSTNAMDIVDAERFLDSDDLSELQTLIAQRVYDLMQSAFIDIHNAQMHQQGVSFHPNAMLRAVEDLTQWPESPDSE